MGVTEIRESFCHEGDMISEITSGKYCVGSAVKYK